MDYEPLYVRPNANICDNYRQEIINLLTVDKWPYEAIADSLGICRHTLKCWLINQGLFKLHKRSKVNLNTVIDEVVHMYCEEGMSREEIAKYFDVTEMYLNNFMHEHAIRKPKKLSRIEEQLPIIRKFEEEGRTYEELGIELGCSTECAYGKCRNKGIKLKGKTR